MDKPIEHTQNLYQGNLSNCEINDIIEAFDCLKKTEMIWIKEPQLVYNPMRYLLFGQDLEEIDELSLDIPQNEIKKNTG